jgi:hypothetical protein
MTTVAHVTSRRTRGSSHEERSARQARAALLRDIERDHKHKAKKKLRQLREELRAARLVRKNALSEATSKCRTERIAARDRTRMERLRALEELRRALHAERQAARDACTLRKEAAKKTTSDAIERAREELAAERKYQDDLHRIEHGNRQRRRETTRTTAAERRSESDDEVRSNIPSELHSLFERVKRGIKGSARETRTEAFLRYAEEHPDEVLVAIDDKTDQVIRDLERQQREVTRHMRRPPKYTPAQLADVPF